MSQITESSQQCNNCVNPGSDPCHDWIKKVDTGGRFLQYPSSGVPIAFPNVSGRGDSSTRPLCGLGQNDINNAADFSMVLLFCAKYISL